MIEIIDKHRAKLIINIGSGENRKRRSKVVEYSGKRDLERQHREFEAEARHYQSDLTVAQIVDSYISSMEVKGGRLTTTHGYRICEKRIIPVLGAIKACDLTSYQVNDFVISMGAKYAPKTIKNTISVLNSAYNQAIEYKELTENPCTAVSLPPANPKEPTILDAESLIQLLHALEQERIDYIVGYKLGLFLGLRRSEILGIREQDVNLLFKQLTIKQGRHFIENQKYIGQPKSKQSRRVLAIPDLLVADIEKLINEHHAQPYNNCDYLIQDGFGEPIKPNTFTNHISGLELKYNIPHVTVHGLRHTFASMLNDNGVNIKRISTELGHSNVSTTLNIYTHIFGGVSESSRGIAEDMNNVLRKSATFLPLEEKEKA